VTLQVPLAAWGRQIVIHHTARPGTGVEHAIIAHINGYVVYPAPLTGEEEKITRMQRLDFQRNRPSRGCLEPGGTRQCDSVPAEDVLDEAGAVKAGCR
jgi:hypothetical protein